MRALVVDESSLQRRFVTWLLREFNDLEVHEAADSATALSLLLTKPFSVVVLELKLGGMDGLTLLSKVRQNPGPNANVPVIVVSTQSDEAIKASAQQLHVVEYLTKPVPAVRVRDAIARELKAASPKAAAAVAAPEDKRQAPRLNLSVTISFAGEEPQRAETADISAFGAFIITAHQKPVGTVGRLSLKLPHVPEAVETDFRVIHVRAAAVGEMPQGFGVRFITESPEDLARLVRAFESPRGAS